MIALHVILRDPSSYPTDPIIASEYFQDAEQAEKDRALGEAVAAALKEHGIDSHVSRTTVMIVMSRSKLKELFQVDAIPYGEHWYWEGQAVLPDFLRDKVHGVITPGPVVYKG